jgi:hypothetical protein
MSDTLPERPTFTSGQYIGAADLNATVDYARDETRRLALSGRTWGIATGLALVEVPDSLGNVQMFIEPGIAWDGYGRPVVVLAPAPVTLDLFASSPTGNQSVWLRYSAAGTQAIAPGFQTCGAGDPTTRVLETYAIEAGTETVQQQTDGVVIGGATIADPRDMLIAVDANAAVVLDGSAGYQTFPDDTARWLIPVGIAAYTAGSPGSFSARSNTQLALSRSQRRYMGVAAENLLAVDGVLRLRDRQTDNPSSATDTQLDQAAAIQPADIGPDPNNSTRLIGNELVWVEGNMRVTGNARMFGTQLELRDSSGKNGAQDVAPEFLRSAAPASNPLGGQDLQVCIGSSVTGTPAADRLTIGVLTTPVGAVSSTAPDGALHELMAVRTDGRVAIGTNAIDSYSALANNVVVATTADTGITVVSDPTKTGNLFFADGTSKNAQKDGYVAYDHSKSELALGAGAATVLAVTPTAVVIGDADPADFAGDTDQLIVASSSEGAGITISGKSGTIDTIDFADGTTTFDAGFIRYFLTQNRMSIGTSGMPQVCIDSLGRVGIGTQSPDASDPTGNLVVASSGILGSSPYALAGDAGITIAASGTNSYLGFGNAGQLPTGFVKYDNSVDRMDFVTSENVAVSIDASGNVGIGTTTPAGQLQVKSPVVAAPYSLVLDTFTMQALSGTTPSPLQLQPQGSSVGIGTATPASLLQVHASGTSTALVVDSDAGTTALRAAAGTVTVGAGAAARTTLDVQGAPAGTTSLPAPQAHVAIIENTLTGGGAADANVLALLVDTVGAGATCHFATFYSGGTDIGAIVGTGNTSGFGATITYATQAADYAEAVPRAPDTPPIGPNKIVGVRAGVVSLATDDADAVFVTSETPAMLARMPSRSKQAAYENLAFLGQVRVKVSGKVHAGDLILASGNADGMGRAVRPHALRPEDLPMIVGRAWESADDGSTDGVNTHVGPGVATVAATAALLARQAEEIKRLSAHLARRKTPSAE